MVERNLLKPLTSKIGLKDNYEKINVSIYN